MKKINALLLYVLLLIAGLQACNNDSNDGQQTDDKQRVVADSSMIAEPSEHVVEPVKAADSLKATDSKVSKEASEVVPDSKIGGEGSGIIKKPHP